MILLDLVDFERFWWIQDSQQGCLREGFWLIVTIVWSELACLKTFWGGKMKENESGKLEMDAVGQTLLPKARIRICLESKEGYIHIYFY